MWTLSILPFLLQAAAILFDEGWFHLRRGLPRWERIGHPIDTLTVLLCFAFVLWVPYSKQALFPYCLLAIFSCIMVTKDEFVHKEHCPASENWLHAILFILHPITLFTAGMIWPIAQGTDPLPWLSSWSGHGEFFSMFLKGQASLMACFMLYQIIYWNFVWEEKR